MWGIHTTGHIQNSKDWIIELLSHYAQLYFTHFNAFYSHNEMQRFIDFQITSTLATS